MSSASNAELVVLLVVFFTTGAVAMAGRGLFAAGATINGCVLVICKDGRGAAASGKTLMRAVSFFGPTGIPD